MTLPLVVLAGLADRRRRPEPAVHRRPPASSSTGSSRSLEGNERVHRRRHRHQGRRWPSSPPSPAWSASPLAVARLPAEADRAGRARDPRRGLALRQHDHRLRRRARPSRPSRPSPTFDRTVVDGAVNGVGRRRARRRQRPPRRSRPASCAATPSASPSASSACSPTSSPGSASDARLAPRRRERATAVATSPLTAADRAAVRRRARRRASSPRPGRAAPPGGPAVRRRHRRHHPLAAGRLRAPATPASSSRSKRSWIADFGISWHLGIDGISLFLVVLSGLLFPLAIVAVTPHHDPKPYYAWLLVLQGGCIGVFCALDLFVFFVMFEIVLVPMYFLIGGWGYAERVYAALKFFIFTMLGSALMLVGIVSLAFLHQRRRGRATTRPTAVGPASSSRLPGASRTRPTTGAGDRRRRPRRAIDEDLAERRGARANPPLDFDLVEIAESQHVTRHLDQREPVRLVGGPLDLPRLRGRVRGEGAAVPAAHLAARRPHPGAHRGLGDPGRRDAEARHLRVRALRPLPVPRGVRLVRARRSSRSASSASSTAPSSPRCSAT